jgi:photosystem II stability/assembly factor-like uncharacterized protein
MQPLDGNQPMSTDGEVAVDAVRPTSLAFRPLTSPIFSQEPLAVGVEFHNALGEVLRDVEGPVTLRFGANPGGANLLGQASKSAVDGVATFFPIGIDKPGVGYTLVASAEGLPEVTSAAFDVGTLPFQRVTTGLYGGDVQQIAFGAGPEPIMYASTPGGIFRSTNRGVSWASSNFGNSPAVGGVVADPQTPGRVYAIPAFGSGSFAGSGSGVTRSDDGGSTWLPLRGLPAAQVGTFVIDPLNPNRLYAGNFAGIVRSLDGGATWTSTSITDTTYAIAVDPITPSTVYAAQYDTGIFKSTDSGDVWASVNNPALPVPLQISRPVGLVTTPTSVFALGYRSTNGGATWTQVDDSYTYAYAPSNPRRVYAGRGTGFSVSDDGGATFAATLNLGVSSESLAVDPADADRVFAATSGGILLSTDGGRTFADASVGINIPRLRAIVLDSRNPSTILVSSNAGIYRTTNGGIAWQLTEFPLFSVSALLFDEAQPNLAYACISNAFYRSSDGGATWSEVGLVGDGTGCDDIVVSGGVIYAPTSDGPRRSMDGGATWQATGLLATTYAVAASANGSLFAGTNVGSYRSVDGGASWSRMTLDLPIALLVDRSDPNLVYMGLECASGATAEDGSVAQSSGGILRSRDGGLTWEPTDARGCIQDLFQLPSGELIAIARSVPFVSRSTDGQTWLPGGEGIDGEPEHVAVSPDGQTVYVTTTLGLFRSTTGGL